MVFSRTAPAFSLLLMLLGAALAGPMPRPLMADLDLADRVVVGKIAELQPQVKQDPPKDGADIDWADAVIAVEQVLTGEATKEIRCRVATAVRDYGGASAPAVHALGDEGIWLFGERLWYSHILLDRKHLELVERLLKELTTRRWSEPVNGLRAWAASTPAEHKRESRTVIIFAVQNASDQALWCPNEVSASVTITAVGADGNAETVREDPVPGLLCVALAPGQVQYLHRKMSFIDPSRLLPPGRYEVTVALSNQTKMGKSKGEDVPAWTGTVSAPPISVELR